MSNLLRKGQAFLNGIFKTKVSSVAYYIRDGISSNGFAVTMTPSTAGPVVGGSGHTQVAADRFDFLCDQSDLVLRGVPITPAANDAIVYEGRRYAIADDGRDACWRPSGIIAGRIRIHTIGQVTS